MATALTPDFAPFTASANGPATAVLTVRQRCEILRGQLEAERASFIAHWKDLNDYIRPRRGRFAVTDVNKGDRRSRNILDSTATFSARVLSAGMMSGITSPARPWFRLTTPDQDVADQGDVKQWLHEVEERMRMVFLRSNLYNILPIVYGDLGVFGTSAMAIYEDDESVIRCYDFPVGSYFIANDDKLRVRTFGRVFRMTVDQIVKRWGDIDQTGRPCFLRGEPCTISATVQNLWMRGNRAAWIDIVHIIQENLAYDGNKIDARFKAFEDIYYELGTPNVAIADQQIGVLSHQGFDEFPVLCPRWETNSEDVYATDCPGMTALGDIKELQTRTKRQAQAVEKMITPPMTGPSALRQAKASLLPGDITYLDVNNANQGFKPAHEVNFGAAFGPLEDGSQKTRLRIQRAFYEDLFLMLSQSDRREITAREIDERHEEKLLALGPVLERLNQDLLDPLIERTFAIMSRKGLIPPAPDAIQGQSLRIDYVSIMAQAQKAQSLSGLERFAGFIGQTAEVDPSVLDKVNSDELVNQYADATGIAPKIVRSDDEVQAMRDQKAKAAQQQQAAANMPGIAGAAKDLSQTQTTGNSVLANLVSKARARQTLNATANPVPAGGVA